MICGKQEEFLNKTYKSRTHISTKAWNYGLYCNDYAMYDFYRNHEDLSIDAMPFNYEFDLRDALGLKY